MLRRVDAALAAAGRGLALFPLPPGSRRPEPGWHQQCTTDPQLVYRMLASGGNVGMGCRASQVVGLDLDQHPSVDGVASFAAACAAHGEDWPDTLTVRTPHGGLHLYFRAPPGLVIGSTSGGRTGLGPGIDTRGPGRRTGGYLIGPSSIVDGAPYVIERDTNMRELPGWLADLLAEPGQC